MRASSNVLSVFCAPVAEQQVMHSGDHMITQRLLLGALSSKQVVHVESMLIHEPQTQRTEVCGSKFTMTSRPAAARCLSAVLSARCPAQPVPAGASVQPLLRHHPALSNTATRS
jgi:hypothetical protein